MAGSDSTLGEQIRTTVVGRLESHAAFSQSPAITVLRRFSGNPDEELELALGAAGRAGVIVTASEPSLVTDQSGTGTGIGSFEILVVESPELNRGAGGTGRTAQQLEEAVIDSLVAWSHGLLIGPIVQSGSIDRPEESAGMVRRIPFAFGFMIA